MMRPHDKILSLVSNAVFNSWSANIISCVTICIILKGLGVELQCRDVWNLEQAHFVHLAMQMNSVVQTDCH